jgi:hypothetical protein
MAESKKRPRARELTQDEVIARLVTDPADVPDVIAMVGLLGKSPRPELWRLYTSLDLKDYIEVAAEDIVHSESLKTERQPLGGTVIWVRSGARLRNARSESALAEADFMQGEITRKFLGGTGMEGLLRKGENVVLTTNTFFGAGACCSKLIRCALPVRTSDARCYTD